MLRAFLLSCRRSSSDKATAVKKYRPHEYYVDDLPGSRLNAHSVAQRKQCRQGRLAPVTTGLVGGSWPPRNAVIECKIGSDVSDSFRLALVCKRKSEPPKITQASRLTGRALAFCWRSRLLSPGRLGLPIGFPQALAPREPTRSASPPISLPQSIHLNRPSLWLLQSHHTPKVFLAPQYLRAKGLVQEQRFSSSSSDPPSRLGFNWLISPS